MPGRWRGRGGFNAGQVARQELILCALELATSLFRGCFPNGLYCT